MDSDGDFSSSIVQEVAAALTDERVPEKYIHKNGYTPAEEAIVDDLLIDFSRLSDEDEFRKLRSALSTLGYFQIVNQRRNCWRRFWKFPKDSSRFRWKRRRSGMERRGCSTDNGNDEVMWGNQAQNWNDRLFVRVGSKDPADLKFWPENPPEFRKTVHEFTEKIQAIPEIILKAMARSLDLQENCFVKNHGLDGIYTLRINLYPQCPNPDSVLGLKPHTDGTVFTLLLQDKEGLEVMANDRWYKVPIIPGALVINVGDLMEIMSNGAIKSTMHRVVTNLEKQRISVAMFYSPKIFTEIGPVEELVTTDRPQLYKKITMMKYTEVYKDFNPKGKRSLSAFQV